MTDAEIHNLSETRPPARCPGSGEIVPERHQDCPVCGDDAGTLTAIRKNEATHRMVQHSAPAFSHAPDRSPEETDDEALEAAVAKPMMVELTRPGDGTRVVEFGGWWEAGWYVQDFRGRVRPEGVHHRAIGPFSTPAAAADVAAAPAGSAAAAAGWAEPLTPGQQIVWVGDWSNPADDKSSNNPNHEESTTP